MHSRYIGRISLLFCVVTASWDQSLTPGVETETVSEIKKYLDSELEMIKETYNVRLDKMKANEVKLLEEVHNLRQEVREVRQKKDTELQQLMETFTDTKEELIKEIVSLRSWQEMMQREMHMDPNDISGAGQFVPLRSNDVTERK